MKLKLQLLGGEFAVCRLSPEEPVPAWAEAAAFASVTRTKDELSVVCDAALVPPDIRSVRGWRLLKFHGPFPFSATGVLSSVLAPLAHAGIGIIALSTFDTDYVLIKRTQTADACHVLRSAGHEVAED